VNFAYPLIPLIYVSMNGWVFLYFVMGRRWEALWSLLTIVGGALVYHFYVRKQSPQGA